jgi:DNA-binding response OmpR family regulator
VANLARTSHFFAQKKRYEFARCHLVNRRIGCAWRNFAFTFPATMPVSDPRPIIVADDNADDLFFARRALQKSGVGPGIVTCTDGSEVVALLKTITRDKKPVPRAIFLDVKMPQLDGFQTLKWIREQKHLAEVCVFMLSGSGEVRDMEFARTLGADDYLVKYPAPADFSRVVEAAERRKQSATP